MPTWFVVTWCGVMALIHWPAWRALHRLMRDEELPKYVQGWIHLATFLLVIDFAFWAVMGGALSVVWYKGLL